MMTATIVIVVNMCAHMFTIIMTSTEKADGLLKVKISVGKKQAKAAEKS